MGRPPKAQSEQSTQQVVTVKAGQPRFKLKGQAKCWHHLFKASIGKMKRNESFQKGIPKIVELDHTHIFHSVNSQMKPQQFTSAVGGHFHEVEWKMGEDGQPYVSKCSPPIRYQYVTRAGGQRRIMADVAWDDKSGDRDSKVSDNHVHTFDYIHSEEIHESQARSIAPEARVAAAVEGFEDRDAV